MYEDSWYSFVPDIPSKKEDDLVEKSQHRRRESLLKQPNGNDHVQVDPFDDLFKDLPSSTTPPQATVARRAKSYSDFHHVARTQLTKDLKRLKIEETACDIAIPNISKGRSFEKTYEVYEDDLLEASRGEYQLYRDQLALSERHLDNLLEDTSSSLDLLANLSEAFKSVEAQTMAFQAQCEGLLTEQKRLKLLSDELEADLKCYASLEPITRRLNAPGASSILGDDGFFEILTNLDTCIEFMIEHPEHRESEVYLTRYKTLLARTFNLIRIIFTNIVKKNMAEAKRLEAENRKLTENHLNLTGLYMLQAPESRGDVEQLKKTMEFVVTKAKIAFDAEFEDVRQIMEGEKDYLSQYQEALESYIKTYVEERQCTVPGFLNEYITVTLPKLIPTTTDLRFARDYISAVIEVLANENARYILNFAGSEDSLPQHVDKGSLRVLGLQKGVFRNYLNQMCGNTTSILQRYLSPDIPLLVELAIWTNSLAKGQYRAGEDGSARSDDEDAEEAGVHHTRQVRAQVASQMGTMIMNTIFLRMKEILRREIEQYTAEATDLKPHVVSREVRDQLENRYSGSDGIEPRAEKILGEGLWNAYLPVKTATRLLVYINDLSFASDGSDGTGEIAYEILHQTCTAIMRAAGQVSVKSSQTDGRIFAIKNLVLIKNLILAYEISGSRVASKLEIPDIWNTFIELRNRGGLFDISSYYNLLTNGTLLPKVVQSVLDARTELDGLMRETITLFREECAGLIWNKSTKSEVRNWLEVKKDLQIKLQVMFPYETELRANLWQAVEATVDSLKQGRQESNMRASR